MNKQQETEAKSGILWGGFCTLVIIVAMVYASEYLGEREIIFPETAALAVGAFLAPKLAWRTDYLRLVLCITLCAIAGECIVAFLPGSLWIQMAVAYVVSQIIYVCSGTTLAPMISAILLPVLLQTTGIVYPLAVFFLCVGIVIFRAVLVQAGVRKGVDYQWKPSLHVVSLQNMVFRCIAVTVLIYIAFVFQLPFCVAPPLLMAFTELAGREHPARGRLVSVMELVTICALAGTFARYYLSMTLENPLPLYIVAIPAVLVMILCMYLMRLYFPPAGAILVLALLIPEQYVLFYPLQILAGIFVLGLAAWRLPQKSSDKKQERKPA